MELEPRTTAPAHATGAVSFVPLAAIADDVTFRLREEGDVAALAASIGRLGQLAPIELRPIPEAPPGAPRYQVVAGFRRLAALRMLMRERVLARLHPKLEDEDAWGIALGQALLTEPLEAEDLRVLRERLAETGLAPWADELAEDAMARAPVSPEDRERFFAWLEAGRPDAPFEPFEPASEAAPDAGYAPPLAPEDGAPQEQTVEVTPEELAQDLAARLYAVNQDLALAWESWKDLSPESRRTVLEQARYVAELFPYLVREDR